MFSTLAKTSSANTLDKVAWLSGDDGYAGTAARSAAALGRWREQGEEGEEVNQRRGKGIGVSRGGSWTRSCRRGSRQVATASSATPAWSPRTCVRACRGRRQKGAGWASGTVSWACGLAGWASFPFSIVYYFFSVFLFFFCFALVKIPKHFIKMPN